MPKDLGGMTTVSSITLNNNNLSGFIPSELGDIANLGSFSANNNALIGAIPASLARLPTLSEIDLSHNKMCKMWGSIPPFGINNIYATTVFVDISFNYLSGHIPSWYGKTLGKLDISSNYFCGPIPLALFQSYPDL